MATATHPVLRRPARPRPGVLYPHAQWYYFAAMVLTWIGFAHSYFARLPHEPLLHHVHGALMGGWIALLILQPILYQRGRIRLHRTLGRWGVYLLVPGIVVCGSLMVRSMLRGHTIPPGIVGELAFLDISSLLLFPTFVTLSILFARDLNLHARWISCTVLLLMPPALTRALFILPFMHSFQRNVTTSLVLVSLVFLLLLLDDARRGRIRAPYLLALAAFLTMSVAASHCMQWPWWNALTARIAST